jgi:ATP-binding cassette subfamily B protein
LVLQGIAAVTTACGLLATASVFTRLLAEGPTPQRLLAALPALGLVAGAVVGHGLLQAGVGAARAALIPRLECIAQDELYTGLVAVDLLAFDDPGFTGLLERATTRGFISIPVAADQIAALFAALVSVLAAVVAVAVLDPLLAPLVGLAALPQAWASLRGAQVELAAFLRMSSGMRRRDIIAELVSERGNAAEIRAFTMQAALLSEHRRINAELTEELVRAGHRRNLLLTAGRGFAGLGALAGYVVLGLLIYAGGFPLALAGTAVVAMRTATQAISEGALAVNELFDLGIYVYLYRRCIADTHARRRAPATHNLTGDPAVIELTDVTFGYPAQTQDAVRGIDLTLRQGQVIALVGENGSGKSTLAKLITGLYLPSSGTVAWDGVSTDKLDPTELHNQVSVVMQEPLRWPSTAGNNIRIGRLERTHTDTADTDTADTDEADADTADTADEDTEAAVFADATSRSGADSILAGLPQQEHTLLSRAFQNGYDLSGGQWQRIAVARGLYRDAAVIVADEPTSAMDARAEHAVFSALGELSAPRGERRSRITVLITHRLANIRHADRIVVLDKGRIVEQGTHDELMAGDGTYRQLFDLQAHAYRP